MSTIIDMLDTVLLSVAIIVVIVAVMLLWEPDLADSLMSYLDKHTELLSCQKP